MASSAKPAAADLEDDPDFAWADDEQQQQQQQQQQQVAAPTPVAVKAGPIPFGAPAGGAPSAPRPAAAAATAPGSSTRPPPQQHKPPLVAPPVRPPAPQVATAAAPKPPAATLEAAAEISPADDSDASAARAAAGTSSDSRGGAGGSGGWGGWLGAGALGSKLQAVALGAARDLQELTASVQQAVAEGLAAEDVSEADKLSQYQAHPTPSTAAAAGGSVPPAPVTATRRDSHSRLAHSPEPVAAETAAAAAGGGAEGDSQAAEARRREVLRRLQGADTQLESGLKVIDDQVDVLAANAVKALGSLWGGLKTISTKVETVAKAVGKELAVGLEEGVAAVPGPPTALRQLAEKGLESAAHLLDASLGTKGSSGGGSWPQRSAAADYESSFEGCYELFGGTGCTEELEHLSSECAHVCNNARAKLQQQQREQIDAALSQLMPLFDVKTAQQQQQQDAAAAAAAVSEGMQEALDAAYAPVAALIKRGKHKASQLQEAAAEAAAKAAAAAPAEGDEQPGEEEAAAGPSSSPVSPSKQQQQRLAGELQQLLGSLRSLSVKSSAEIAAGNVMQLLALGRSVAALPRFGKPLDDGLDWPPEPQAVGAIMRGQVLRMLGDVADVAAAFAAAAAAILSHTAAGEAGRGGGGGDEQLQAAVAAVDADRALAATSVSEAYSKLLYVVLLAVLHRAGKGAEQVQTPGQAGGKLEQVVEQPPLPAVKAEVPEEQTAA